MKQAFEFKGMRQNNNTARLSIRKIAKELSGSTISRELSPSSILQKYIGYR